MVYAYDITITSAHRSTSAVKTYIQPYYIHKIFAWTNQNNLTLNLDKTTCTLFTLDPAEFKSNLDLKINNISVQAHKLLQIITSLTATGWVKQKKTLMAIYKGVMRTALEYASSIWPPLASSTSVNRMQH